MLTSLKPYVPFPDLRLDPFWDTNDLFGFPRFRTALRMPAVESEVPIEVKELEGEYHVKAALPGVTRENIHVAVDGNTVTITAEMKTAPEPAKGEKLLRNEFYYGKLERMFTLLQDVDEAKCTARYENGVLELILPKKVGAEVHTVAVQ